MIVTRTITITKEVTQCSQCPYFNSDKEVSTCDLLKEVYRPWEETIVEPGWQEVIDPKCPLKK
jgi:hypothetical protein